MSFDRSEEKAAASAGSEGAIPPTGGVPPEDARPARATTASERSAADDLLDGINLMLRAARKTLHSLDPQIEATAERAMTRLQEFDEAAVADLRQRAARVEPVLGKLATEAGHEMAALVERLASRLEAALANSAK